MGKLKEEHDYLKENREEGKQGVDIVSRIDKFLEDPLSVYLNYDGNRLLEFITIYDEFTQDEQLQYLIERRTETSKNPIDRNLYSVLNTINSEKRKLVSTNDKTSLLFLIGIECITLCGIMTDNDNIKKSMLNRVISMKGGHKI